MTEELEKEIAALIYIEMQIYSEHDYKYRHGIKMGIKIGAKSIAEKYLAECSEHEKTKVELETARQLCRQYSEAIASSSLNPKIKP